MSDINVKETVLKTMHYCFDKSVWHPSLDQALDGVTAEQASWRPADGRNSIWELVRHITLWKKGMLNNWEAGSAQQLYQDYSPRDWQPIPKDAVWADDLAEMLDVSRAFIQQIEKDSAAFLLSVPEGAKSPRIWNIVNNATHDAYHAGQIMYLRKLQE